MYRHRVCTEDGYGVWAKMGKSRGEVVYGPEAELLLLWQITDGRASPTDTCRTTHPLPSTIFPHLSFVLFSSHSLLHFPSSPIPIFFSHAQQHIPWPHNGHLQSLSFSSFLSLLYCIFYILAGPFLNRNDHHIVSTVQALTSSGLANGRIVLPKILQLQKPGLQSVSLTSNMDQLPPLWLYADTFPTTSFILCEQLSFINHLSGRWLSKWAK